MTIEDIVESKGFSGWSKVIVGLDLDNSMLSDSDIKLIQKRVVEELTFLRREFALEACKSRNFSLCEAYSDFSRAAYAGLSDLCFSPKEVLNNLPRKAKNYGQESIEKTVLKVKVAQGISNVVLGISGAVVLGSLGNTPQNTSSDYLTMGLLGVVGGAIGYFASKAMFYFPLTSLKSRLNEEKSQADKSFVKEIDKYIAKNI